MRRFEFVDSKSSKFWQVSVQGATVQTQWGRIGTAGQTKSKDLGTANKAQNEADKQIRSKVKKGYVEVAVAGASPSAGAPSTPSTSPVSTSSAPPVSAPPASPVSMSSASAAPTPTASPAPVAAPASAEMPAWTMSEALKRAIGSAGADPEAPLGSSAERVLESPIARARQMRSRLPDDFADAVDALAADLAARLPVEQAAKAVLFFRPAILDVFLHHHGPVYLREVLDELGRWNWHVSTYRTPMFQPAAPDDRVHSGWVLLASAVQDDAAARREVLAKPLPGPIAEFVRALIVGDADGIRQHVDSVSLYDWPMAYLARLPLEAAVVHARRISVGSRQRVDLGSVLCLYQAFGEGALDLMRACWDHAGWPHDLPAALKLDGTPQAAALLFHIASTANPEYHLKDLTAPAMDWLAAHAESARYLLYDEPTDPLLRGLAARIATQHPDRAYAWMPWLRGSDLDPRPGEDGDLPDFLADPPWRRRPVPRNDVKAKVDLAVPEMAVTVHWDSERERDDARQGSWGAYANGNPDVVLRELKRDPYVDPSVALAWCGVDAVPYLDPMNSPYFADILPAFVRVQSPRFAPAMARGLAYKSVREHARRWLVRYPEEAVAGLLPDALGSSAKERRLAQAALRVVGQEHPRERVLAAAEVFGSPKATAALTRLLDADPLHDLPKKIPDPKVTSVRPIALKAGGYVQADALVAVCEMLALSTPEQPYVGVERLKALAEPDSLARFAWSAFEAWLQLGGDPKTDWCLYVLAWYGSDAHADKLAGYIRDWPAQGAFARAVKALDVLREMGTDHALMLLHRLSLKGRASIKERAEEKITALAGDLGLSKAELEDRLVPDLDLDPDGSTVLDFGPRQFRVGFDERLQPVVKDENGKRRKSLPKPGAKDDPELGAAATERWKTLKKAVRTVASVQLLRLEHAMLAQRRWSVVDWERFLRDHPLMVNLTRRLVWATHDAEGARIGTFRLSDEGTLVDADEEDVTLPDDGLVGLPHPVELSEDEIAAWSEIFADFELTQPFDQLGRAILRADEAAFKERVAALTGATIPVGATGRLRSAPWQLGTPQDAGYVWDVHLTIGEVVVDVGIDPGIQIGGYNPEDQKIGSISVRGAPSPIVRSEVILAFDRLIATG